MVNEAGGRPRLTPKGRATRARIVEEAAALIHERGVAGTTLDDVKAAAEVSGSQMYHYFPDKNDLVQAVTGYQAGTIVNHQRHALGSANGVEAWRNLVITAAERTEAKGAAHSARSAASSPRATPRPGSSSRPGSNGGQPPSAINSDPFMSAGSSRPASTRTTSPLPCSPRSREGFSSPRCNGAPARSKPRSIPSSPLPSADEPKAHPQADLDGYTGWVKSARARPHAAGAAGRHAGRGCPCDGGHGLRAARDGAKAAGYGGCHQPALPTGTGKRRPTSATPSTRSPKRPQTRLNGAPNQNTPWRARPVRGRPCKRRRCAPTDLAVWTDRPNRPS
jgi:hypothetical protein